MVTAALSRASSLPSRLPSMSSLNKKFLPSYTLPPTIRLPPIPTVVEDFEARPIVERSQSLPVSSSPSDALSIIPTISITDPNNSTHTPVSPSVSSSTCSSFASSFAFELGPAWTEGEKGGRRVEDDPEDEDEEEEDDEEFAYDYQSHFAQFSFGRPEAIPEEDEEEEDELELDDDATIVGSGRGGGRGRGRFSTYEIGGDALEDEEHVETDGSNFDSDEEGYGEDEEMIDSLDSFPRVPSTIPQSPVS